MYNKPYYTEISNLCNPSFVNQIGYDCNTFFDNGWCPSSNSVPADFYIVQGVWTDNGIQTGLSCPQCGCNVNPPSLYDVHWEPKPSTPLAECVYALRDTVSSFLSKN